MLVCAIHHARDDVGGLLRFSEHAVRLARPSGTWMAACGGGWPLFPDDTGSSWISGLPDLVFSRSRCFTEPVKPSKELM